MLHNVYVPDFPSALYKTHSSKGAASTDPATLVITGFWLIYPTTKAIDVPIFAHTHPLYWELTVNVFWFPVTSDT